MVFLLTAFLVLGLVSPSSAVSVTGFTATDGVPMVLSGDSFVLKFTISNDTSVPIQFTSMQFAYENVDGLPSYFGSAAAADFAMYSIFDRNGVLIGQTVGGVGPNAAITIINNANAGGDSSIPAAPASGTSSRPYYLVIGTNATYKQFVIKLKINNSDYNGVVTAPSAIANHTLTSDNLQVLNIADIDKTDAGKYAHVVGAGAGPFYLWDWTIDNRTSAEISYKDFAFTCTNVRGFVPGAQADNDFNPLSYTGDIERFILEYGASAPKSSKRRKKLYTGGWGIPAPNYKIILKFKDDDDEEDDEIGLAITANSTRDFKFGFYTNQYVSDLPSPGGVVPGDAFYATVDSWRVTITPSPTKYTFVGNKDPKLIIPTASYTSRTTVMTYFMLGPIGTTNQLIHPHLDYNATRYNDVTDLDFISYRPVFYIPIVGGPSTTHALRAVSFLVTHREGIDLTAETSPLNPINQTDYSGIQLRRTDDNTYSMADPLYPPDVNLTSIQRLTPTLTRIKYVIYDKMPLPTDSGLDLHVAGDNMRMWVGIEPSKHAMLGDSLMFQIVPYGFEFRSGLVSYETQPLSLLAGSDTYVQAYLKMDSTQLYVYPLVDTTKLTFGLPTIFHDLTNVGQIIPPNSTPKALAGFNMWDHNQNAKLAALQFFVMDAIQAGGDALSDNDFDSIANNTSSGWAIYRDNDSHPNNTNGQFDAGVDSFVSLAIPTSRYISVGNTYSPSLLSQYGSGEQPLIVHLFFENAGSDTAVPNNDEGVNSGDDFFLVCRTSPTIAPTDKFRIVIGEIDDNQVNYTVPGIMYSTDSVSYYTDPAQAVPQNFARVFSRGYVYRTDLYDVYTGYVLPAALDPKNRQSFTGALAADNMRTEVVSVSGGIAVNVSSLIIGQKNVYRKQEVALFGINAVDTQGGALLYSVMVDAQDSGTAGNFDTIADLAFPRSLTGLNAKGLGLAIFRDNGDSSGQFDSRDSIVPGTTTWRIDSSSTGFTRFKFTFSPPLDFADDDVNDNAGFDYFVVATMGDSMLYQDDFAFRIAENAFEFIPPGVVNQPPAVTTNLFVAGLPVKLIDLPDSGSMPTNGEPVAHIGIMAADTTQFSGSNIFLSTITLNMAVRSSSSGFPSAILQPLVAYDTGSGVTVWMDANGDRMFQKTIDTPLVITNYQWATGNKLVITIKSDSAPVPDTDPFSFISDTAAFFFVALRATTLGMDESVVVSIEAVNEPADPWVKFTAPSDGSLTLTPNVLVIAPPGVSGTFFPKIFAPNGTGSADTVTVQLTVIPGNSDSTWLLNVASMATGEVEAIGDGAYDSTVYIAPTEVLGTPPAFGWPTDLFDIGGAFTLSFSYDWQGTSKNYTFGDTLYVDLYCTAPVLIGTLPTVVTSGSTIAVSIAADSARGNPDAFALTYGESTASYYIYRMDGAASTLMASGTLANYEARNISVPIQAGANTLVARLRDTFGNMSETTTLGDVSLSVGSNELKVQNLLTDLSNYWLGKDDTRAVFGINVTQRAANEAITKIRLQIFDSGAFAFGNNIKEMSTTTYFDTQGLLIFRDNPDAGTKGTFDPNDYPPMKLHPAVRNIGFASGDVVTLIPDTPLAIPENDTTATTTGYDYFIVMTGGGGGYYKDSFSISIPVSGFEFATTDSANRRNLDSAVIAGPILSRIPRNWVDLSASNDSITAGSNYTPIFGLDIMDTTRTVDGGVSLQYILLNFTVASGETFNPAILAFQVYADSGASDSGVFSLSTDSAVTTQATILSSTQVLLDLSGVNAVIPSTNSGNDSGADFWICIRPSVSSVSTANKFTAWIPYGGVVTTGDSPGGPGVTASSKITIPQGGVTTAFAPNPFRPSTTYYSSPYNYFETAGYSIKFSDTRGFTVRLYKVSTGETFLTKTGYAKETTVLFNRTDTTWTMDEYKVVYTDTVTNTPTTEPNYLYADLQALTPTLASTPAATTTSSQMSVTIRVTEQTETPAQRARSKAERDSIMIVFKITSTAGDTTDTAYSSLSSSSVDISKTLNLVEGLNTVVVTLVDGVGNSDSSLTFSVTYGAAITGNIGYSTPLFKWTPTNSEFTFTFPTTTTGNATVEIYNIGGDRMRLINISPGSPLVKWDAKNDRGQLLRNGVYLVKFKVPLSNGQTIEETRTIFLLK